MYPSYLHPSVMHPSCPVPFISCQQPCIPPFLHPSFLATPEVWSAFFLPSLPSVLTQSCPISYLSFPLFCLPPVCFIPVLLPSLLSCLPLLPLFLLSCLPYILPVLLSVLFLSCFPSSILPLHALTPSCPAFNLSWLQNVLTSSCSVFNLFWLQSFLPAFCPVSFLSVLTPILPSFLPSYLCSCPYSLISWLPLFSLFPASMKSLFLLKQNFVTTFGSKNLVTQF